MENKNSTTEQFNPVFLDAMMPQSEPDGYLDYTKLTVDSGSNIELLTESGTVNGRIKNFEPLHRFGDLQKGGKVVKKSTATLKKELQKRKKKRTLQNKGRKRNRK